MSVLITGGTGFLGKELIRRLNSGVAIRVVARNEGKLIELKSQFPDIEIITGCISDPVIAAKACQDIETCYHLAAYKHVGLAETQPYQCTLSNVVGTIELLKSFKGGLFTAISTDKAAQVSGMYGATKFLMEGIIREFESMYPRRRYRVVRYGNVLYSTGSVLCKWRELIKNNDDVVVTNPDATRFFWTVSQAVDLIFECNQNAKDSTPYIPQMKAMSMGNLLNAVIRKYNPGYSGSVKVIGLQSGENIHETMDGITFSNQVEQYTIDEIIPLI